jgi:hypothetical protein
MKSRISRRVRPRFEALEQRLTLSTSRPIADFLVAQGTTSKFPNGVNAGGPAGLPDENAWTTSTATFNNGTAMFARIDYTGQDAAFLHLNLGTTTSGTITERVLNDGTVQDTVILHTHNAFAWANFLGDGSGPTFPVTFGYQPSQLAANPTLVPPVANSDLQLVFGMPRTGAPLPDLVVLANLGGVPGYTLESIAFHATSQGPTPTGQQATLVVSQVGVLNRTPNLIRDFGFTAEVVSVQTHGSAPAASSAPATSAPAVSVSTAAPTAATTTSSPATTPSLTKAPDWNATDAVFADLAADALALDLFPNELMISP